MQIQIHKRKLNGEGNVDDREALTQIQIKKRKQKKNEKTTTAEALVMAGDRSSET